MFMNKPVYLGLSVYIRVSKWNCNVQILVWLRKTKIQRKGKIILYGYRYSCTCKKIFMKINMKMLQKMFKKSVILQTMS